MPSTEVFPTLLSCTKLGSGDRIYDVKFYPYGTSNDDQIFATVAEDSTFVYRIKPGSEPPFERLRCFRDEQTPKASFNSLVWTKDPVTRKPLLCIAGHVPKHIKILDVDAGRPIRTLSGHGRGINDLAVSPLSTNILASGAEDTTIRIWNLHPAHQDQPCVALLGGEGHKSPILAIHFHPNGKWLLSGGIDNAVCLWSMPHIDDLERKGDHAASQEPMIIYYPHFVTQEVHSNYVDSLAFYGDLIISRAARDQYKDSRAKSNEILIWKIDGFDSDDTPPDEPPIPVPLERTRSSFPHDEGFRGFQRLLTLSMPSTDRFYHRFGLLQSPDMRPILAMGNQESKYHFWDLQRLDEGIDPRDYPNNKKKPRGRKPKASTLMENQDRLENLRRSESVASGQTPDGSSDASVEREFSLSDRFKAIDPHKTVVPDTKLCTNQHKHRVHFATSQIAWSPDGTWMIGVGDWGMMCIFHRDKSVVGSAASVPNGSK